jgi:Fe-Mn family superoxide dismutase
MKITKMEFEYSPDITVINREQFDAHMRLYEGYIKKINEIDFLLLEGKDLEQANATYSQYRGVKRGETYALNGVILHELYFQNIGDGYTQPHEMIGKYLIRDFGSFEDWQEQFIATAKASRGWAILLYDWRSYRFRNISFDAHDVGNIIYATPAIVLDVYEHAYFLQYAEKKDVYINNFMNNIKWQVVEKRMFANLQGQ